MIECLHADSEASIHLYGLFVFFLKRGKIIGKNVMGVNSLLCSYETNTLFSSHETECM